MTASLSNSNGSSFKINRNCHGSSSSHLYPGDPSLSVPVDGTMTPSPSHSNHHHRLHQQQLFPGSHHHVSMVNNSTAGSNSYSYSSPSGSNATTTSIATLPRNLYGTIIHSNDGNTTSSLDAKLLVSYNDGYSVYDSSHLNLNTSSSSQPSAQQNVNSTDINI